MTYPAGWKIVLSGVGHEPILTSCITYEARAPNQTCTVFSITPLLAHDLLCICILRYHRPAVFRRRHVLADLLDSGPAKAHPPHQSKHALDDYNSQKSRYIVHDMLRRSGSERDI